MIQIPGGNFYSRVTELPFKSYTALERFRKPVWATERGNDFPADRMLQPRASEPSPDQLSQQSDRQPRRTQTSKFYITESKDK